jgi:hypothetical protein
MSKIIFRSKEELPFRAGKSIIVEHTGKGYWAYLEGNRSPGAVPEAPLHLSLAWVLQQIVFGHAQRIVDEDGEVVGLRIGRLVPNTCSTRDEAAEHALREYYALQLAGILAEFREKGSDPDLARLDESCWQTAPEQMRARMEAYYGLSLMKLLGRLSKKFPQLEHLPIVPNAPAAMRGHLAEATRCFLLKLDRACVALCRACLEEALKSRLTGPMLEEWHREMARKRRTSGDRGPMCALITVCARHGLLKGREKDAHEIREAGNRVLHDTANIDAYGVLSKTRKLIAILYGARNASQNGK